MIGAEVARLLREYGAGETPQALKRRGGFLARPRKASAWSGIQQPNLTEPLKKPNILKKYRGIVLFDWLMSNQTCGKERRGLKGCLN
ncbi:hypothetical protein [Neobacillus cucumis]|uniref:hypothetical protein n=1 Tax=Neobacillus cucumis TaxID=1740721 RepID=UPI0015E0CC96|nr:hypothetical protein [Neobacillus cucumis]